MSPNHRETKPRQAEHQSSHRLRKHDSPQDRDSFKSDEYVQRTTDERRGNRRRDDVSREKEGDRCREKHRGKDHRYRKFDVNTNSGSDFDRQRERKHDSWRSSQRDSSAKKRIAHSDEWSSRNKEVYTKGPKVDEHQPHNRDEQPWTNAEIDNLLEDVIDDKVNEVKKRGGTIRTTRRKRNVPIPINVDKLNDDEMIDPGEDSYDPVEDDEILWNMFMEQATNVRKILEEEMAHQAPLSYEEKSERIQVADERVKPIASQLFFSKRITKDEYKTVMKKTVLEIAHAVHMLNDEQIRILVDANLQEMQNTGRL